MGLEVPILAFFVVQACAIFIIAAWLSARRAWSLAASSIIGGLVGFAPLFIDSGPRLFANFSMLLVVSVAIIILSLAKRRRFTSMAIVSAFGALLIIGSKAHHGGPAFLGALGLLHEIAVLAAPLFSAIAARTLVALLTERGTDPMAKEASN